MKCVFAAKLAKLLLFKPVGIILLVLRCVVIPLLALGAGKCDFDT